METNGKKLYGIKNSVYIKPSITTFTDEKQTSKLKILNMDCKKGLFLCGWQLNKNIMLIPEIALNLKNKNFPFCL